MNKWTVFMIFLSIGSIQAQSPFEAGKFQNEKVTLPYKILYPENYNTHQRYPIFLFLHGAGERGADNSLNTLHAAQFFLKENKNIFPGFVVVPQCPTNGFWGTYAPNLTKLPIKREFDYTLPINPYLEGAVELIQELMHSKKVDKHKIYIMGLSMGGMGTFEAIYRYPKFFAAAVPICGGGDDKNYDKRVKKTAFWVFHGDADTVVPVELSRVMVNKIEQIGGNVKYKEYPGVNHNSWDHVFVEPELLNWIISNKK